MSGLTSVLYEQLKEVHLIKVSLPYDYISAVRCAPLLRNFYKATRGPKAPLAGVYKDGYRNTRDRASEVGRGTCVIVYEQSDAISTEIAFLYLSTSFGWGHCVVICKHGGIQNIRMHKAA